LSTGVSAPSSSPGRVKSSTPAGRSPTYGAKTPASIARLPKVLSTPNATSPIGLSALRTSWLVSAPASPPLRSSRS
jgi:hypothetical protein